MTIVRVKAHTRGVADPFATLIEARRRSLAAKYGIELVETDDERLKAPLPAPVHGPGRVVLDIAAQLLALAKTASRIGRN